jgi:DNA repair protein RadC
VSAQHVRRVVSRLESTVAECSALDYTVTMNAPRKVVQAAAALLENEAVEVFGAFFLNAKHRIIGWGEISRGTINMSLVHPREVFGPAIRLGCAGVIVVHNHPSGDPTPSREDIEVTRRLARAGGLLGVHLLDHIVIGGRGQNVSIRGLVNFSEEEQKGAAL